MSWSTGAILVASLVVSGACTFEGEPAGRYRCGGGDACPTGTVCQASGFCEAPLADAGSADAMLDPYVAVLADLAPTHWWRLDETSGAVAVDAAGGADGAYKNSPALGLPGLIADGSAVLLAAPEREHVEIPNHGDWEDQASLSIVCLHTPRSDYDVGHYTLFARATGVGASVAGEWYWGVQNGELFFGGSEGSAWIEVSAGGIDWAEGQRYHLAVVWTGSVVRFYRDGVQIGSDREFTGLLGSASSESLQIGAWGRNDEESIDGTIDEVAYWKDTALSSADIEELCRLAGC